MAQGKAYTPVERESIIQSLQPYLEMGFSRNKACEFVGLTPQTLSNWVQDDESLLIKLTGWENVVNTIAVKNIVDSIKRESALPDDIKKENSWKWAERRMKEDFSTRTESDVTSKGERLQIAFDNSFNAVTQPTKENSTEQQEIQSN